MAKLVISYIPALHQGYLNFFNDHPGDLLVLGRTLVRETPRMDRDVRALDPNVVAGMVRSLKLMKSVKVLEDPLDLRPKANIILPDEDVNRTFAANHLQTANYDLIPVFLRWDQRLSTTEYKVQPHRQISTNAADRELMALAAVETGKSPDWWRQIGAVLAVNAKPVLIGHNRPLVAGDYSLATFGDPRSNFDAGQSIELSKVLHAESGIIAQAAARGLATQNASLYVTTFPCPVCAKLVAAAGIAKVYYRDGYSLLDAEDVLTGAGVELIKVEM